MLYSLKKSFFLVLIVLWNRFTNRACYILESVFDKVTCLDETMYIFDKALLEATYLIDNFLFEVPNLFLLILFPLSFFSHFLSFIGLSDSLLSPFKLIGVLSDILLMVLVHTLKAAILRSLFLVFLKNLVHHVLAILLILPTVRLWVASILTRLWRVLVVLVVCLIVVVLSISIIIVTGIRLVVVWLVCGVGLTVAASLIVLFLNVWFT